MRNVWLITRRELGAYFRTPSGYLIAAAVLLMDGLLFNAFALGSEPKLSSDVLQGFFYFSTGTTLTAAILLSMRLLAEERQSGTLTLLFTSAVRESEIIAGKFLSAFLFFAGVTALTLYMPALVMVHGKVSIGHIVAGYSGLLLLGSAAIAVGVLGSTLARSQLVAGVISALLVLLLTFSYLIAKITDPPLTTFIHYLGLYNPHFTAFQRGLLRTSDVVFYLSITYAALLASTRVLQSQRWQ